MPRDLSIVVRPGWIVQIGIGTVGKEKSVLERREGVAELDTIRKVRYSFRARRVDGA